MLIADSWLRDLPQQFQAKNKIEIIIRAFSRQLQEVYEVFETMEELTGIEKARGINLDRNGDNVCLTRADAHEILRKANNVEITDDVYRNVLKYGILRNTSDCTYEDVMTALYTIWPDARIEYSEDPKRPATIILKLEDVNLDDDDIASNRVMGIKADGVLLAYHINYMYQFRICDEEKFELSKINVTATFPFFPVRLLDGSFLLDGSVLLDSEAPPFYIKTSARMQIPINADETFSGSVVIKKDLWYLDGKEKLDGSRLLDAAIKEEEL